MNITPLLILLFLNSYVVLADSFTGNINATNESVSFYGFETKIGNRLVRSGDIIEAYDVDGIMCGRYVVENDGLYGVMEVYRDDPQTTTDEGACPGEEITFHINGQRAEITKGEPFWTENKDQIVLELHASEERIIEATGDFAFEHEYDVYSRNNRVTVISRMIIYSSIPLFIFSILVFIAGNKKL